MRQAGKALERLEHGRHRQSRRLAQRQRRERIGGIVQAGDFHARDVEQRLAAARQERLRAPLRTSVKSGIGALHAKRSRCARRRPRARAARIAATSGSSAFSTTVGGMRENPRLGARVASTEA